MKIGGLQKVSLIDYPGKICAVVFTRGCNFRCPFCHNASLVLPERFGADEVSEEEVFGFLEIRKGKLDAVVISGGEPTVQRDLPVFIGKIKSMGYEVKLDTNGTNPGVLEDLLRLNLLDYLAMDIKAPFDKYPVLAGRAVDIDSLRKSISLIMNSGLEYEFRTTMVRPFLGLEQVMEIGGFIPGAKKYVLQQFSADGNLISREMFSSQRPYTEDEIAAFQEKVDEFINSESLQKV